MESKRPNTLRRNDWIGERFDQGGGRLRVNAAKIARVYLSAMPVTCLAVHNSTALVGLNLDVSKQKLGSTEVVKGMVLFEDRREVFLPILLQMLRQGVEESGL